MNHGQNLMDANFFDEFDAMLGEVEADSAADAAPVLTGTGKFFRNGLSLPVRSKLPEQADDKVPGFGHIEIRGCRR